MKKWLKRLIFISCVLLSLELVARCLYDLFPLEIQQKYANLENTQQQTKKFVVNGHGARGSWPHEDRIRVATIGSSIMAMKNLAEEDTWTYLLEKGAPYPIQIDNYGFGFNKIISTIALLKSLIEDGRHYEMIVLQLSPYSDAPLFKTLSMTYHSRWIPNENSWCQFCTMADRFLQRRLYVESKLPPFSLFNLAPRKSPHMQDRSCDQRLEKAGLIADVELDINEDALSNTKKALWHVFNLAQSVAPLVIWMPEGPAYHPNMRESYSDLCRTAIEIPSKKGPNGESLFASRRTTAMRQLALNPVVRDVAEQMNVKELNWLDPILSRIQQEDGLYFDEHHLSAKGSREVAKILQADFYSLIEEAVKIRNK